MSGDEDDYDEQQASAEFVGPEDHEIPDGKHLGDMWPGTFTDEEGRRIATPERGEIFRNLWERRRLGITFPEDVLPEEQVAFWDAVADGRVDPPLLEEMTRLSTGRLDVLPGPELRSLHQSAIASLGASGGSVGP